MMKKCLALILGLVLLCSVALAEVDMTQWNLPDDVSTEYSDAIAYYYDALDDLTNGSLDEEQLEELRADMLLAVDSGCFGYTLQDLDGDGMPELIFATVSEDEYFGKLVLELFTVKDGEPVQVFKSGERDRYYYAGGNLFAHVGSSSAFESIETTEALVDGEMVDLGYETDPADYVQLEVEVIALPQE